MNTYLQHGRAVVYVVMRLLQCDALRYEIPVSALATTA